MIDIHCHILPGIDDGAKNIEDSMLMAKEAVREGIHTIIATPHHKNNQYENEKRAILEHVSHLNKYLENEGIPLTILPGQENRIYGEIITDYLSGGKILPLAESSYLFIEFPSGSVPRYAERLLYELQTEGLIPIIVHPERNQEINENPDLLYKFVNNGALTQVTAGSVCGYFGKNIKKFSRQLIEANLTHFIASDAHNVRNRTFKMVEAMEQIEKSYGLDMVYLFRENAELLVENKNVYKEIPEKVQRKKFLGLF
ncbi:tyrosine protein phosphatase [Bacillus sp. V3B]|uniref:tyrosine-protein phosphatase n=1 Tax=Bacillus sp. V3B TaxID=2804915 RepID=UPI00210B6962|nr:CpsB/CapC family capsule biosynthesis tyrosine phosphatase [Bacillus sp. V3B]MCQ6274665.1 tyrosine protein phosphatase [Bacillus sp. V3B]